MEVLGQRSVQKEKLISEALLERILAGLGFDERPTPSSESLRALYSSWCQKVPFDNVRKLIHVRSNSPGLLPGSTPTDFFEGWLRFRTGGTCWAGAGAFHALLVALGFEARRGVATMLAAPDLPPNHGTVGVTFGSETYLVDCSILHGEPLRLAPDAETVVRHHQAWGVQCFRRDGRWFIRWRPLNRLDGFECRLERFGATNSEFAKSYEQTRGWSPFNYQVTARTNRGARVVGVALGNAVSIEKDGSAVQRPLSLSERKRVLVEEVGISEEIVQQLPEDVATPPPPGSRTAQGLGSED